MKKHFDSFSFIGLCHQALSQGILGGFPACGLGVGLNWTGSLSLCCRGVWFLGCCCFPLSPLWSSLRWGASTNVAILIELFLEYIKVGCTALTLFFFNVYITSTGHINPYEQNPAFFFFRFDSLPGKNGKSAKVISLSKPWQCDHRSQPDDETRTEMKMRRTTMNRKIGSLVWASSATQG